MTVVAHHASQLSLQALIALLYLLRHQLELVAFLATLVQVTGSVSAVPHTCCLASSCISDTE